MLGLDESSALDCLTSIAPLGVTNLSGASSKFTHQLQCGLGKMGLGDRPTDDAACLAPQRSLTRESLLICLDEAVVNADASGVRSELRIGENIGVGDYVRWH